MKIFYSWQSDLPQNRKLLAKCLEQVADVTGVEVETATRNATGSPDIAATILAKIDGCDLFLADVSIINPETTARKTPNPNVMYELGYALKALGEENIVLVANKDTTNTTDLPFDIRNRRMILESFEEPNSKKSIMQSVSAAIGLAKPKANQPVPPKVVFIEEHVKWANWGLQGGAFCGFRAAVSLDNYRGESDYITDVSLHATDADGNPWQTSQYRINETAHNKLFAVPPDTMTELTIFLSDSPSPARRMPDLDRDSARIVFTFRSGKQEILQVKPAFLIQD